MAEIRKYVPSAGGSIAQAMAKAMGESVRPVTPGAPPDPGPEPADKAGDGGRDPGTPAAITSMPLRGQFVVRTSGPTQGSAD